MTDGLARRTVAIRDSYKLLRGVNLSADFVRQNDLKAGQKYSLIIDGYDAADLEGTLRKGGFVGGLAALYRTFDLNDGDEIEVAFDGTAIRIYPPPNKRFSPETSPPEPPQQQAPEAVFERFRLRHLCIEPYSPSNLSSWTPQTEADVYMVFGALSEFTDYRYCCGASKALLDRLGYPADKTKPDAVLIERTSLAYLMAEFKVFSRDFCSNHKPEDVDVLVCWEHDETDLSKCPPRILCLRSLLENLLREGSIEL